MHGDLFLLLLQVTALLGQHDPNTADGRQVAVHLFEWKWDDIARECEDFLSPFGYAGVQVSPPQEHIRAANRPWWERYQPVSYKLDSRSGSERQFADMVRRCNNVGVRIYVDAIINHMTGADVGSGTGIAGCQYNGNELSFPCVPYSWHNFNDCTSRCGTSSCNIESYGDARQVRNCRLLSLVDLDQGNDDTQNKIVAFLNKMIRLGVAGFRIDAAKHMWPGDLSSIVGRVEDLNSEWFPSGRRPYFFMEVIDQGGEPITSDEYTGISDVTEFKYGLQLGGAAQGKQQFSYFRNFGEAWGFIPSGAAWVFVDNHDNQRGHGGGGNVVTHTNPRAYKIANAFMMAWPYGFTKVMSSFSFNDPDQGPPSDGSGNTDSVVINADSTCGGGWVCEHRWRQIRNVVKLRNVAHGQPVSNWWSNGAHQIAFSRGDKAFLAINNEGWSDLNMDLQTGLPQGTYCDVISGECGSNGCSGTTVTVDGSGRASVSLASSLEDPMLALHVGARPGECGDGGVIINPGTTSQPQTHPPTGGDWKRTLVFMRRQTSPGQDLFVRGGISHDQASGCTNQAGASNPCSIPIRHVAEVPASFQDYLSWRQGDNYLDWYGAESGQGTHQGVRAQGSPLAWSTNSQGVPGFQSLNQWGDHYWMLDVEMDCSKTQSGWFEVKAVMSDGTWEGDINQQATCQGSSPGSPPFSSKNHLAMCGMVNMFSFNDGSCYLNNL